MFASPRTEEAVLPPSLLRAVGQYESAVDEGPADFAEDFRAEPPDAASALSFAVAPVEEDAERAVLSAKLSAEDDEAVSAAAADADSSARRDVQVGFLQDADRGLRVADATVFDWRAVYLGFQESVVDVVREQMRQAPCGAVEAVKS